MDDAIANPGSAAEVQYPDLKPKESINPGVLGSAGTTAAAGNFAPGGLCGRK